MICRIIWLVVVVVWWYVWWSWSWWLLLWSGGSGSGVVSDGSYVLCVTFIHGIIRLGVLLSRQGSPSTESKVRRSLVSLFFYAHGLAWPAWSGLVTPPHHHQNRGKDFLLRTQNLSYTKLNHYYIVRGDEAKGKIEDWVWANRITEGSLASELFSEKNEVP